MSAGSASNTVLDFSSQFNWNMLIQAPAYLGLSLFTTGGHCGGDLVIQEHTRLPGQDLRRKEEEGGGEGGRMFKKKRNKNMPWACRLTKLNTTASTIAAHTSNFELFKHSIYSGWVMGLPPTKT